MITIGNVTPNQKLELIRMIRMQNQTNRYECRERERFLYGNNQNREQDKELYGTELTNAVDGYRNKHLGIEVEKVSAKDTIMLNGFRIRFALAVILMALFIYLDRTDQRVFGKTMEEVSDYLTGNISITETFHESRNLFDL